MSDTKELIARFRKLAIFDPDFDRAANLIEQQAKELAECQARVVMLESALIPLATLKDNPFFGNFKDLFEAAGKVLASADTAAQTLRQADQQAQPVVPKNIEYYWLAEVFEKGNGKSLGALGCAGHTLRPSIYPLNFGGPLKFADEKSAQQYISGAQSDYEGTFTWKTVCWAKAVEHANITVTTSPPAQPADQQTHGVEDSPEYKLGLAAGKASYARHYKCGCTAFPADAPAYCPIHSASQKETGK